MSIDWITMISDITWQRAVNFFINLGITGVVFLGALKFIAQRVIDFKVTERVQEHKAKMDKQLEDYKSDIQQDMKIHEQKLQVLTEEAKFGFARKQQDFGLYNTKRHEVYLKLHQAITEAQSRVINLRGYRELPDYSRYSKDEIIKWLDDNNFAQEQRDSVLNFWDTNKPDAVREAYKLRTILEQHKANLAIAEAQNIMIDNQLYTSDTVLFAVRDLIKNIGMLLINYKSQAEDAVRLYEESEELKVKIEEEFNKATKLMKQELKKGYYNED